MTDAPPLFEFVAVTVAGTDGGPVLDEVTASLAGDGITCVLGASGAGKSTLLRLCNRLEVPAAGTVRFRGTAVEDLDVLTLRRQVGMVFQRPTVFPGTVEDNLRVAAPDAARERLVEALEAADLDAGLLARHGDDLSVGEAQRVCLARTLVTGPEVLLADEPTSALDRASRQVLERLVRRLADDGAPVVWVTHDLAQAERLADDVLVLVDGRVAQQGPLAQLRARPAPAVAALLGGEADTADTQGGP